MRRNLKTSMETDGLVSVLMPLYNAEAFVEEAIESVLSQTYEQWELIIVNDGSTDRSLELAKQFESDKIHVLTQPNSGACVARNKAIQEARGEYVKFLDADDVLAEDCIEKQIEQIRVLKENQIPFGDYDYIDKNNKHLREFSFGSELVKQLVADQPYFFFSRWEVLITSPLHRLNHLLSVGGFDVSFKRGQESDLHFRLALAGVEFVYCPCHTFSYREYQSSSKITSNYEAGKINKKEYWQHKYRQCEKLLMERYGELPVVYQSSFARFWFDEARDSFALANKKLGKELLIKSRSYKSNTKFQSVYYRIGHVIGFVFLEKVLRLRLRLLKKAS